MSKNISKLIVVIFIALILILYLLLKVNTNIFIGDHSRNCCKIDIQIKLDNKQILNDSLSCNPLTGNYQLKEKLKYGLHKIHIHSNKANVNQEEKIFLFPNQYISIEFFPADTLCLSERMEAEKTNPFPVNNLSAKEDSSFLASDTVEIFKNAKSKFLIESRFNPFYLE